MPPTDQQQPYQDLPPVAPQQPQIQPHPAQAYDFIVNPGSPTGGTGVKLPNANSMLIRVAYAVGGLLVLLIVFSIVKGIIVGKPKLDSFVKVAQDQEELIHIATGSSTSTSASSTQNLSAGNQNIAATINATITSNQSQVLTYLTKNSYKNDTNPKVLELGISSSVDTQLTNSQSAGTYNQVFQQIMVAELNNYISDLKVAYNGAGKNGKALMKSDYAQAELLLTGAQSSANAVTN